MTVPVFGVDVRTMTGSIAQLETVFVVTEKKRRHLQRPLDLQVNSPTEWLLTQ